MKKRNLFGRYHNPHEKRVRRGFSHFLLWHFGYYNDPYPQEPPPSDFSFPNPQESLDYSKPLVCWVNHSTFWIHAFGYDFLIDPIWSERCSPLNFIGPKRRHPPPFSIEDFSKVDFLIITHNHYDHMDKKTLLQLFERYPSMRLVVPKGVGRWFKKRLPKSEILELDWWEEGKLGDVDFTAVPAQHFSGRGLFDRNQTLWMGVVIKVAGKQVYCAGDTGYNKVDFKEIGRRFGGVDLALLPIGAYAPRRFMQAVHVNPEDAVLIHEEVGAKQSLGGHFGTFRLSEERVGRPPYDLYRALEQRGHDPLVFRVVDPGDMVNW